MHRIALSLLLGLFFLPVSAQIQEERDGQIVASVGDGIKTCYFSQEKENWCWAACLQMVLYYNKVYLPQRAIVKRVFNPLEDRAASTQQMIQAINGYQKGKRLVSCWSDSIINLRDVIGEIQNGFPLIIGMEYQGRQHAMVLTHIFFQKDATREGKIIPTRVVLVDPSRPFLKERSFSWAEFSQAINMALHLRVTKPSE